jgi:hypothetical protein
LKKFFFITFRYNFFNYKPIKYEAMKKIFFLISGLLLVCGLNSQTKIAHKQEISGTWTKSGSPYIIEGEAIIPEGATLIIKPGVLVQFKTGNEKEFYVNNRINPKFDRGFLRVNGKIIAQGKKKDFIKFMPFGSGNWGNISVYSRNIDNLFEYCSFESSFYIISVVPEDNATGALTFNNAAGTVKNCLFAHNGWTAINCKNGSDPKIINTTIVANQYGIECNSYSKPVIENTIVWDNENSFYINGEAKPAISFSLFPSVNPNGEPIDAGNNLKGLMPEFVDANAKNYKLKKKSPALKKGRGGANIGAF